MATLPGKVDAVKTAVASPATCTTATVVTLRQLLLSSDTGIEPPKTASTTTKPTAKSKSKATIAEELSAKEKTALATHVVNVTIKALNEAAKPAESVKRQEKETETQQAENRPRTIRRSLSTPLSPIQPRTLNRTATSPNVSSKVAKAASGSNNLAKCAATVECARAALAWLRSSRGPVQPNQADFQVEAGMSTLIAKLLTLGLNEYALKELRLLKDRLQKTPKVDKKGDAPESICDLLNFQGIISPESLVLVATCQLQVLKVIAAYKKPAQIESSLPFLCESHQLSPINVLTKLAQKSKTDAGKAARQMASLSQLLLSLAPSISTSEDHVAKELRLSVSPAVAFELQALAFKTQLTWWKLAGHKGDADNDVLSPFSRCLKCFARRSASVDIAVYETMRKAFNEIEQQAVAQGYQLTKKYGSPSATVYECLAQTAYAARHFEDAAEYYQSLRDLLQLDTDSPARICSTAARLLSCRLREKKTNESAEPLIAQVQDGIDKCLNGTASDLNELLDASSAARRSVVGLLKASHDGQSSIATSTEFMLKTFLRRFPRFVRRWMGSAPGKDVPAKQLLQFEQRRQVVMQSICQVLDSALMVVMMDTKAESFDMQELDSILQDCADLLNSMLNSGTRTEQLAGYHVKISTLYFNAFNRIRTQKDNTKAEKKLALLALQRSIDAVKDRSAAEKEKAQLSAKLELLATLCKASGRGEDTVRTLRSLCTNMVEEGLLANVAAALASQSPSRVWTADEKVSTLSRTLRSIAKSDNSLNDWTCLLQEPERAAVLEHLLDLKSQDSATDKPTRLHDAQVTALLRIYSSERFPIRRFRVLLKVFSEHLGRQDDADELATLIDLAQRHVQKKDLAEDASLFGFVPHLQTLYSSITALGESEQPFSVSKFKEAVSTWQGMITSCKTQADIFLVIDDPQALMEHLLAVNQLAGLRGEKHLQLSVLQLAIELSIVSSGPSSNETIQHYCHLAAQYVNIGLYTKASDTLEKARIIMGESKETSQRAIIDFHLIEAEYLAGIADTPAAMTSFSKVSQIQSGSIGVWAPSKTYASLSLGQASLIQSLIALQNGDIQAALEAIRGSVKLLSHDWAKIDSSTTKTSSAEDALIKVDTFSGPQLWALATPLLKSFMHISSVYAHIGMFQETIYYAESAMKIAESAQSSFDKARVSAWMGSIYVKASQFDKAVPLLQAASDKLPREACSAKAQLAHHLGEAYAGIGEEEKATEFLLMAEETARAIDLPLEEVLNEAEAEKPAPKRRVAAPKTPAKPRAVRAKTPVTSRVTKRATAAKPKALTPKVALAPKDAHLASLLASIILTRTMASIRKQDWSAVASALELVKSLPKSTSIQRAEQLVTASSYIGMSDEQIIQDPVFSIMHDSTISFPAVANLRDQGTTDKTDANSPPKRGRAAASRSPASKAVPAFAKALNQAQEVLLEAHASATAGGDNASLRLISALLQSTGISLTAASVAKSTAAIRSDMSTVSVELARNTIWQREQLTLQQQSKKANESNDGRPCTSGLTADMANFQSDFIELVPKNWSVISVSVSENQHDLCLTKFEAGHSPFILRLPLERASSRDADSDVFDFAQGRAELLDVIKLANETSHSAKDFCEKSQRKTWWTEREALDTRLKDLLLAIETTWLGGFKGLFSQHERRSDLLARFQKSFHQILDRSLPSRTTVRGKKPAKTPNITLDPRILDLFIGLGDPTDPDLEFDEALNDLLYFVVDILQFHGERNAYDEIDFDGMVVETYDALRGYYQAAKYTGTRQEGSHTVLVLDKSLHAFPWESLPCMESLAVSRVPSLACLRRLLLESATATTGAEELPRGHYVSTDVGTYVLNPSSDLKNTQAFFEKPFSSLKSWNGLVNKAPKEEEFEQALSKSEILLYFGHGGGAQYVRSKTIRRLEKCKPATFLMGCSSAALTEAGEFESYGPVWSYITAGCPAVVGTLWDVTDRDIDRFAGRTFEEWGLLPRGSFKEEKKTMPSVNAVADGPDGQSLAEAVARARGVCRFRYLNAAAVVIYGIPVYIQKT